jgi:hypothetical protein
VPLTKSLGATNLCLRYAPAKCGKFDVHNVSFDFATAISKFDTSLSYHIVRKRIAKVTDFLSFYPFGISIFPFLTIGISMYQICILPYFIIPSTFSPQTSSPLERYRQTDKFQHPLLPKFFFFSTERAGPYPQAQLYWAGRTMGWMAD